MSYFYSLRDTVLGRNIDRIKWTWLIKMNHENTRPLSLKKMQMTWPVNEVVSKPIYIYYRLKRGGNFHNFGIPRLKDFPIHTLSSHGMKAGQF